MTIPDRRQSQRVVLDKIRCIQLDLDNSAIVLNISEGGLAFHAFQPIPDAQEIQFSFSLPDHQRVQATGELVWRDESNKRVGLRFASLPAAIREQIREWVLQGSSVATEPTGVPSANDEVPVAESGGPESSGARERFPKPVFLPPPETPRLPLLDELQGHYARSAFDPLAPEDQRSKFLGGFVIGALVSALALAVVFFFYGSQINDAVAQLRGSIGVKPELEPAQVAVTQPISSDPSSASAVAPASTAAPDLHQAENDAPVAPAASAPSGGVSGSRGSIVPADHRKFDGDLKGADDPAGSVSNDAADPATVGSQAPQTAGDTGEKDLAIAQGYLRSRGSTAGSAGSAVPFLWLAVGKGNVAAELTLAELYARGDGVVRSCDQARVLLYAAASKGSDEADQQLAQIDRARCN
jgi:hypothetical protein